MPVSATDLIGPSHQWFHAGRSLFAAHGWLLIRKSDNAASVTKEHSSASKVECCLMIVGMCFLTALAFLHADWLLPCKKEVMAS
jgi:hypothetical protein